ncbi:hypothetical protein Hdeb2414_s0001g00037221 [Helianthus debilis subsp. tardiflorus]
MHIHNYRVPEPFCDQIVDISKEIAMVAKEVHVSSRSPLVKVGKSHKFNNMWQHGRLFRCEGRTSAQGPFFSRGTGFLKKFDIYMLFFFF